jgi:putative heme-binding domain-containing protein
MMIAMRWLATTVFLCLSFNTAALAQSQRAGRERPERAALNAEEAAKGRDLYNRNCTACHGPDGAAGDRAPALGETRRYLRRTEQELFDAIKNGITGTLMPASPLQPAEIRQIVTYIRSLRATAAEVAVPGNIENGSRIFSGKGGCVKCHTIQGRGGILGPELTNIGGERRIELLRDALTKPRPVIPRGYVPVKLKMKDGGVIEGVVKNEHNFSLQILGVDGKLHSVDRADAVSIEYAKQSLMPTDWDRRLTAAEFQDLLAFLSRQTRRSR